MSRFVENATDFSAECRRQDGRCRVVRENVIFLDDGTELAAVDRLQWQCGYVVIIPDTSRDAGALLYHTSCRRMTDAVEQIFPDCLKAPVSLSQHTSEEVTLGALHRRAVTIAYEDCRAKVDGFEFGPGSED